MQKKLTISYVETRRKNRLSQKNGQAYCVYLKFKGPFNFNLAQFVGREISNNIFINVNHFVIEHSFTLSLY